MPPPSPPSPPRDLNTDDLKLLKLLANEFLLLTRDQIRTLLTPRSIRRTNFRLQRLVAGEYVERRHILFSLDASRKSPFYHLGRRAWELLHPAGPDPKLARRRRRAKSFHESALFHLIAVNAVHIKFLTAHDARVTLLRWIPQYARIWRDFLFRPDGFAEYQCGSWVCRCFVELDRGTERGGLLLDKLFAYHRYAIQQGYERDTLSPTPFRVLFITTGGMRRVRMLLGRMGKFDTAEIFWVARKSEFLAHPLSHAHWHTPTTDQLLPLDTPL